MCFRSRSWIQTQRSQLHIRPRERLHFTFSGFPSGTYTVEFTKQGFADVWFNGAVDLSSATPITL